MQFAVAGNVVTSYPLRLAIGTVYVGGLVAVMAAVAAASRATPEPQTAMVLLLGASRGWMSAIGGAWKDAPIEGFSDA
jgi:hypothetical protein